MATDQQVQHYQEQARQAQALASRLSQAPDVSAFAGMWEAERRQALAALSHMAAAAHARRDYVIADALTTAKVDVSVALRQRGAWAIEEGVHMRFAHEARA
jgi:hypothetical protein